MYKFQWIRNILNKYDYIDKTIDNDNKSMYKGNKMKYKNKVFDFYKTRKY